MKKFFLAPLAEQDIGEIVSYIADDNKTAAFALANDFFAAMEMLAEHPKIGRSRPDLTKRRVRFWTVRSHYLIVYKDLKAIEIVRVLSSYRDIAGLLC